MNNHLNIFLEAINHACKGSTLWTYYCKEVEGSKSLVCFWIEICADEYDRFSEAVTEFEVCMFSLVN